MRAAGEPREQFVEPLAVLAEDESRVRALQPPVQAVGAVRVRSRRRAVATAALRSSTRMRCSQSRQSGTTSSAAPEGVGARTSATRSAMVKSISWPTPRHYRQRAGEYRPGDDFLVERPEVLERAAAAREDQHVAFPAGRGVRERGRDVGLGLLALHLHG